MEKMEEAVSYPTQPYNRGIDTVATPEVYELDTLFPYGVNLLETVEYSFYALNLLRSKKVELKKPLLVVLKETPEGFIAKLSGVNVWGHGDIEEQAVENLCTDLENFYFDLEKDQKNLGKEMQRQWKSLQKFLFKKRKKK